MRKAAVGFLAVVLVAFASTTTIVFKASAKEKNKKCPYSFQWETEGLKICCDDKKPNACKGLEQFLKDLDRQMKERQRRQDEEMKHSGHRI